MIALITAQNPKSSSQLSSKSFNPNPHSDSQKSRLVAKWLLDDQGHLYCQWIKE